MYISICTACGMPPEITNSSRNGSTETDRFPVGTIFEYSCNDDYFPTGSYADQLQTKCMNTGSYSPEASELATCARIGLFCDCALKSNIIKIESLKISQK